MSKFIQSGEDELINTEQVAKIKRSYAGFAILILNDGKEVETPVSFELLRKELGSQIYKTQQSYAG